MPLEGPVKYKGAPQVRKCNFLLELFPGHKDIKIVCVRLHAHVKASLQGSRGLLVGKTVRKQLRRSKSGPVGEVSHSEGEASISHRKVWESFI